jgi:hypothetical protein
MSERLSLSNVDVAQDEDFDEIEIDDSHASAEWGTFGPYQLVGNGHKTNVNCGEFRSHWGCVRTELHGHVHGQKRLDGKDFSGKVYHRPVFYSCDKPSCPVCYKQGWATREAHKIEVRVAELEGQKRFGLAEQFIATVPQRFYDLNDEDLRAKITEVLRFCGVVGGCLIFHGARWSESGLFWYWSPHFHVLGFILGGYKCRDCQRECIKGCGCGFNDLQYRAFEKFGCLVKVAEDKFGVKGERVTVGGTAWYQLHHATIRTDVVRPHCVTWFGVASYRALKIKVEKRKALCPICKHELVKLLYFGSKNFVLDRDSPYFEREALDDLKEDGRDVWVEDTRPNFSGSGSYED